MFNEYHAHAGSHSFALYNNGLTFIHCVQPKPNLNLNSIHAIALNPTLLVSLSYWTHQGQCLCRNRSPTIPKTRTYANIDSVSVSLNSQTGIHSYRSTDEVDSSFLFSQKKAPKHGESRSTVCTVFKEFFSEICTYCWAEAPICLSWSWPKALLQYQLSQHSHHEGQTTKPTDTEPCRSALQSQSPRSIHTCWTAFTVETHVFLSILFPSWMTADVSLAPGAKFRQRAFFCRTTISCRGLGVDTALHCI